MHDSDCVRFLQWALPQLQMRWAGFRKVRKRVCKRLARRLDELGFSELDAYRHLLTQQPQEWQHLDTLCRVVVTRFYRDRKVFAELASTVIPQMTSCAIAIGRTQLRIWSIGSASGEEPYTPAILWHQLRSPLFSHIRLSILGTEIDPELIARSHRACYEPATLKNLPVEWRATAFTASDNHYCLKSPYLEMVEFREQDIRIAAFRRAYGFDDPFLVQYGRFLGKALQGDLGKSLRYNEPALELVMQRLPATLQLSGFSMLFAIMITLPLGMLSALRRNSIIDFIASVFAVIGQSMPNYWLGFMLVYLIAVKLRWLPTSGGPGVEFVILPAVTIAMAVMALITRMVRSTMLEVLNED